MYFVSLVVEPNECVRGRSGGHGPGTFCQDRTEHPSYAGFDLIDLWKPCGVAFDQFHPARFQPDER